MCMENGYASFFNIRSTCIRQRHQMMVSHKENDAKALLQFGNMFCNGWLAEVKTLGSARKAQFFRYRDCRFHVLQFVSCHAAPFDAQPGFRRPETRTDDGY